MARLLPDLVTKVQSDWLAGWLVDLAPQLACDEAVTLVVEFVKRDSSHAVCERLIRSSGHAIYRRDIAVPALPEIWRYPSAGTRSQMIVWYLGMLVEQGPRALGEARRKELAAFLLPRLHEMFPNEANAGYAIVAGLPDLFPVEAWVAASPATLWDGFPPLERRLEQARIDRAARALVADPGKVTDSVMRFLRHCSSDLQGECVAQLYRKGDGDLIESLTSLYGVRPPVDPAVLEEALDRLVEVNLGAAAGLGTVLAEVRPSEKLFRLVERLLASPDREFVERGIVLAQSLGREEMIPHLLGKLDSMDAEVRTRAREAIDSILELRRIKEEVAKRIAEAK
jgi:hypothetical protein